MESNFLTADEHYMYLRKSRADNTHESVEEVLMKHEKILQEYAEKNLGGRIPEHCIFREVVSGETLAERPEMQQLLGLIENPNVKGVLVVDPQRLSRGDLEDCGKVVNLFRFSHTQIVTPNMAYDLENKMERKFFEMELTNGNTYLEYTKEVLLRGRVASIKRGNYIGNIPPFGYDKIKDEKGPTLTPNEYAPAVQLAYDLFVNEGKTYLQIAREFDRLGIKPTLSKDTWSKESISRILENRHYVGDVYFGSTKTIKVVENGKLIERTSYNIPEEEIIVAEGRHPALISRELFNAAQEIKLNNPRSKWDYPLQNPLAGLLFCSKCGKALAQHPYKHARTRYECRNRNGCGSKSAYMDEVIDGVAYALEHEHLPDLEERLKNKEGQSVTIQKKMLEKMQKELAELQAAEDRLDGFLERGVWTEEKYLKRIKVIHDEMEELKSKIYEVRTNLPKEVDYAEKIIKLKAAISALRSDKMSVETKNKLAKAIIRRIDYEYIEWLGKGKVCYRLHIFLWV